jgi:hypothetical protein
MGIGRGTGTAVGHNGAHNNNGTTVIYVVGAGSNAGVTPSINSATYGGAAMAKDVGPDTFGAAADRGAVAIFRLSNAPSGSNTAVASVTGALMAYGYCISLICADIVSPVVALLSSNVTAATLASTPGGIAIAGVWHRSYGGGSGVNPAYGLTELYEAWTAGADHGFAVGYEMTAGVSEQFGWDAVTPVAGNFVTYKAAPAGHQVIMVA